MYDAVTSINRELARTPPLLLIGLTAFSVLILTRLNAASVLRFVTTIPVVQRKISKERAKQKEKFREENRNVCKDLQPFNSLPEESLSAGQLRSLLEQHANLGEFEWDKGRASGCVYSLDEGLLAMQNYAYKLFEQSNPLYVPMFPGLRKMEAEIARMVALLYRGDEHAVGTVTSGGSESIMLAVKAYRDWFKKHRSSSVTGLNMIAPTSIHPAFLKACQYLDVKPVLVPIDPETKRVQVSKIKAAITKGTCAIFVSAPNYPYGVIDPIQEVCDVAAEYNGIPVHVDACFGSLVIPFLDHLKPFDFRCTGVTSISCDMYKYGLAPKSVSLIIYRNDSFLESQVYVTSEWPGGLYVTPNISGSRPGMLIAACWATMLSIGYRGYASKARALHSACRQLADDLSKVEGIRLIAEPETSIVAATCDKCYAVMDRMDKRGWFMCVLQQPPGFHLALTELHMSDGRLQKFVEDVRDSMREVKENKNLPLSALTKLYQTNEMLPDRSIIEDFSRDYVVSLYES